MDKILEVKDLKISFRTANGTVKAVRDISFDLERGKTLAIVGESGSGKSVTSKAILGILAGNAIVEGGRILYDGRDLLRISEEEMCTIRGDKISMIFQDPLSSLNPIVKIGRQITEAMLLKNKTARRNARREFNGTLSLLKENMIAASPADKARIEAACGTFDKFNIEGNKMAHHYNASRSTAEALLGNVEDFLFKAEKRQRMDVKGFLKEFIDGAKRIQDPFLTHHVNDRLQAVTADLTKARSDYRGERPTKKNADRPAEPMPGQVTKPLEELRDILKQVLAQKIPDFFRIGYYTLKHPNEDVSGRDVEELNEMTLRFLDQDFMLDFIQMEEKGVENSFRVALEKKKALLDELAQARTFFAGTDYSKKSALQKCKELSAKVDGTIDRLETKKDPAAYTFRVSLETAINMYFNAKARNPKEEARFAKQTAKREAQIARGKNVDWKVVPKTVYDLDELHGEMVAVIDDLLERYTQYIAQAEQIDFQARSVDLIDYFKEKAGQVVYKVTKALARERAIELMEEVGIPEPRIRYNQYPFEFSGGMRQRIVIAIALAANPDILICDEPTTALDVTIQAQILELINKLKAERNLSVIFITHDLGVVANMADDIAVMYAGKIVEYGTADDIFYDPRHPYTWALLSSMPDLDTKEKLDAIPGTPPNMIYPPVGDAFADRNKYAMAIDFEQQPPQFPVSDTHWAATWLLHPEAPKVEPPKIITDRIARMLKKTGGAQNEQ